MAVFSSCDSGCGDYLSTKITSAGMPDLTFPVASFSLSWIA
jgi:hypothetical protein